MLCGMAQRLLQQVVRTNEGTLEYGWRPDTDGRGDPTALVWTTVATAPVGYKAWEINLSNYGTTRGAGAGRWAVCPICLEEFPISEMVYVKGRYYCIKNKDAQEIQGDT
jgi:hypothetical protein